MFSITSRVINTFFGLSGPAGALSPHSEIGFPPSAAQTTPQPSGHQGSGGISSTMWEESRMTKEPFANEMLVFMNAPKQKNPRWRLWVQSFDPAHRHRWGLGNTRQICSGADGDEMEWYQLTHSEHGAGSQLYSSWDSDQWTLCFWRCLWKKMLRFRQSLNFTGTCPRGVVHSWLCSVSCLSCSVK